LIIIQKSFAFFKCLDHPYTVFVQCPNCRAPLILTEKCDFDSSSCTCSVCGCAWCYLCNWEPHWPMSCEQFKRWSGRWNTQCLFDKVYLHTEKELRMCCNCEVVFEVPGNSPLYPFYCPSYGCGWGYTEDGEYAHSHNYYVPLSPRVRQHVRALAAHINYCDECVS
ncbi:hypothetical protein ANCCAN_23810, partial [Ancylostoma caninum]